MQRDQDDNPPGHNAKRPTQIPARGWWQITKRVNRQIKVDQIQIVSAGIAFYLFLSIFPILAAAVASYGLFTDPADAEKQIESLRGLVPAEAFSVVGKMIRSITEEAQQTLGWSFILSILLSIWSANKGTKALVTGLNIAYDEREKRGFFRLNFITLCLTIATFLVLAMMIGLVAGIPVAVNSIGFSEGVASTISIIRWPILALIVMMILAGLYHWAPDRDPPKWRWVSPGALVSTILWLGGSLLFSIYVEKFGTMSKTYGPFAAVVTLMLWFFLTAFIVLLGAEINAESEHQTACDSTKGSPDPMGQRGAHHADHVVSTDGAGAESDRDQFS